MSNSTFLSILGSSNRSPFEFFVDGHQPYCMAPGPQAQLGFGLQPNNTAHDSNLILPEARALGPQGP